MTTSAADESPRIGVIFVNYHSEQLIAPRARRLADAGTRVVVTDNSSTFPEEEGVESLRPGRNLGFGSACNLGAAHLAGAVGTVVFHNPDVDITPEGIWALVAALRRQSRPGLVGPAESTAGRVRLTGYHYPGVAREAFLVRRWLANRHRPTGQQRVTPALVRQSRGTGRRFAGAALLVADASAFKAVGGFDERYFMYGEDLDLWHRMGAAGHHREFESSVTARHSYAEGSPLSQIRRELYRWVGVELFIALHARAWRAYRFVHRANLPAMARLDPEATRSIGRLWSEGEPPEEVAAQLFAEMAATRT